VAKAAVGDFDAAFATIDRRRQAAGDSGPNLDGSMLGKIAEGASYLPPEEARRGIDRVTEEINRRGDAISSGSTLKGRALAEARLGNSARARELALAVPSPKTFATGDLPLGRYAALCDIAEIQTKVGDFAAARDSLSAAYNSIHEEVGITNENNKLMFIGLADSQVRTGDLEGARQSAALFGFCGEADDAAAWIAWAFVAQSRTMRYRETLRQGAEYAERARREPPEAPVKAEHPKAPPTAESLAMLALDQVLTKDADEALAKALAIPEIRWRQWAVGRIVEARAEAGDLRGALKLAQSLDKPDDRCAALGNLAIGIDRSAAREVKPAADRNR
jgi:hypothetical protein